MWKLIKKVMSKDAVVYSITFILICWILVFVAYKLA